MTLLSDVRDSELNQIHLSLVSYLMLRGMVDRDWIPANNITPWQNDIEGTRDIIKAVEIEKRRRNHPARIIQAFTLPLHPSIIEPSS